MNCIFFVITLPKPSSVLAEAEIQHILLLATEMASREVALWPWSSP